MGHKSDAESMQELTSLMWNRYLKERVKEEQNHEMNAYKAEVVTNNGDGTLTVKRPFESVNLTLKAASSLRYAKAGDMVLVVGIGDKSKALSNAFILCKTDMADDTVVPVYGQGRNLLDNWYFAGGGSQQGNSQFPINSRGLTTYPEGTNNSYCIDRWKTNGTTTEVSVQSDGILVTGVDGSGVINQRVHHLEIYGQTVTYSILYKDGNGVLQLASGTGTVPSSAVSSATTVVSLTSQIPNGALCGLFINSSNVCYAQFGNTTGNSLKVVAAKLELGSVQTLAHQENGTWVLNEAPDYEEELLECQTNTTDPNDTFANLTVDVWPNVNPNLLRNWYFAGSGGGVGELPVNQRGLTSYTGSGFTIDGWYARNAMTIGLQSDGIHLTFPSGSTTLKGLNQTFTALRNYLVGKTVTVSVLIKDFVSFGSTTYPRFGLYSGASAGVHSSAVLTEVITGNGLFSITGQIGASVLDYSNLNFTACYANSYSGSLTVVAAKMELGTQQTLAHLEAGAWVVNEIPDYEYELLMCQTNDSASTDTYASKSIATEQQIAVAQFGTTANRAYSANDYFCWNGLLYRATTAISNGATLTVGTNCVQTTVMAELLRLT